MNKNCKKEHEALVEELSVNYENESDIQQRFGDGSFGAHELLDRSNLILEMWESYIKEHPTTIINEEAFELAFEIGEKIADFYQLTARYQ